MDRNFSIVTQVDCPLRHSTRTKGRMDCQVGFGVIGSCRKTANHEIPKECPLRKGPIIINVHLDPLSKLE